jgi:hypothetical protein
MTAHDEAIGATAVTVDYAGATYTFPASLDDADGDVLDAVDDMKLSHALRGLLSDDDWRRFKATKPKVKDYSALFDAYAKRIGLTSAGE